MRYKAAPGPVDASLLAAVQDAVPLVPGSVEDCCARIVDRTAVADRETAADWLAFCAALDLVERTDRGYRRRRRDADPGTLGDPFRRRVYLAADLLDVLAAASEPLPAEAVFERLREEVPAWERNRHADPTRVWRERTERLAAWAALFGLVDDRADGYALADGVGPF